MSVVNSDSVRAGAAGAGGGGGLVLEQSVRNDGTARTQRTVSGRAGRKMTWDLWIKRCAPGARDYLWRVAPYGSVFLAFNANDTFTFNAESDGVANTWISRTTTAVYRDVNAWYHITVGVDANQTDNTCCKIEINGVEVTSFGTLANPPSADRDLEGLNDPTAWMSEVGATTDALNGYAARLIYIDGYKLDASSFSEFDDDGINIPIDVSGLTWSGEACHLDFADSSDYGNDVSGLDNHYTDTNFAAADQMLDSPTDDADSGAGNFCTMNPLNSNSSYTMSDGNLLASHATATHLSAFGTHAMPSGKWYWEVTWVSGSGNEQQTGICPSNAGLANQPSNNAGGSEIQYWDDTIKTLGVDQGAYGGTSFSAGDVIQIAYDADAGDFWVGRDGTFQGDPGAGTGAGGSSIPALFNMTPFITCYGTQVSRFNFGSGGFDYTVPTGFKALCTANLPAPAIVDPSAHFQTTLYTGNGTAIGSGGKVVNQSGNSTFQPDFVWIKNRDAADSHLLINSVGGATKYQPSDTTLAEATDTESLSTFDSDGFTVGSNVGVNTSSEDYVAWQWLADNTSGSSNTDGAITSTVANNSTAGFSIGSYTGTGSATTVGHGLGVVPDMLIVFPRGNAGGRSVYHDGMATDPETDHLILSTAAAKVDGAYVWNDTAPTSSVFSVQADNSTNGSSRTYMFYAWHSVEGFSKFGSYTGNGSADGPFVHCGFRPAYVMIKNASASGDWQIHDTARDTYNVADKVVEASTATAELTAANILDLTSNGFKIRATNSTKNGSGNTLVYAAFAEHPFGGVGVNQARAR